MAEEAEKIRTTAKTRFTRRRNEFLKSVRENRGIDTVKRTFVELHEAWSTVEGKHDLYTLHLTEEEIEHNETWINELQELYNEAAAIPNSIYKRSGPAREKAKRRNKSPRSDKNRAGEVSAIVRSNELKEEITGNNL